MVYTMSARLLLAFTLALLAACGLPRPAPDDARVYVQVETGWDDSRFTADGFTAHQRALNQTTHILGIIFSFLSSNHHQDLRGRDIVIADDLASTSAELRDTTARPPGRFGDNWDNLHLQRDPTGAIHLTIQTRPDVPYHDTFTVVIPCPERSGNALILTATGHLRFNGETLQQP